MIKYCKRCYFRVTKFSRLAAQKHIRGLLNSRWADAHLLFWYCTSFNEWYIYMYVTGQHKNKAGLRQTWVNNPFASTHMVNTCPKCAYKVLQIFSRVFEFALAEFARNTRKLMYREYFHFYSNIWCDSLRLPCPTRERRPRNYIDCIARDIGHETADMQTLLSDRDTWCGIVYSISDRDASASNSSLTTDELASCFICSLTNSSELCMSEW